MVDDIVGVWGVEAQHSRGNEVPAGNEIRGTSRTLGVLDLWEAPHNGGKLPHNSDHLDYLVKVTGIRGTRGICLPRVLRRDSHNIVV